MLKYSDMLSVDAPLLLGVKLRPLSLGHVIHMQEQECIFISPVKVQMLTQEDKRDLLDNLQLITNELIVALTICSLTYDDFNALCENHLWVEDRKAYITMQEYMSEWSETVKQLGDKGEVNIVQSVQLFNRYLDEGYKMPDCENISRGEERLNESPNSVDWITTLVETITSEKSVTVKEVIDQPLKLTFLQFFKLGERQGAIHFVSEEERALRELATKGV